MSAHAAPPPAGPPGPGSPGSPGLRVRGASRLVLALCAAALLGACGPARGLDAYGDRERSPTALDVTIEAEARAARAALDSGDPVGARALLEAACARARGDVGLALMLQEAELAAGEAPESVRARYLSLANERADAPGWILAARLEPDAAAARAALERALAIDPRSAWALYGQAYLQAREGLWADAQTLLARALELDPAHLSARHLEAALLARDGRYEEARTAYDAWLEASRGDPRVDPSLRVATELDLAIVELESGSPRAARDRLARLEAGSGSAGLAGRRLCLIAATEQALGHSELALEAARGAELASPESPLPKVQQALLYEQWLGDPAAAKEAWSRVLGEARTSGDLTDLIQSMRARVVLERLEAGATSPERAGKRP